MAEDLGMFSKGDRSSLPIGVVVGVPFEDVKVSAAKTNRGDSNQDIALPDPGTGHFAHIKRLDIGQHTGSHC